MKKILLLIVFLTSLIFSQSDFKFAWLTDIHIGYPTAEDDLKRSVDDINTLDSISFTIISGDITAIGSLSELTLAKQILDQLERPYYIIPGNHDTKWSESGCTDFLKLWINDRFVFEYDDYLFIGLHQGPRMRMADGYFAPEDLRWFDSIVVSMSNSEQAVIFITHYPLDESISNWYEMLDRLKNLNTQVVLFGHGHMNKFYNFESIAGVMGRSNLLAGSNIGRYNIAQVKNDSMYFYERIPDSAKALWHQFPLQKRYYQKTSVKKKQPDYLINQQYPKVSLNWEFNTGYTIGSSVVRNKNSIYFGDASGIFYSISFSSGLLNWEFITNGPIYSTAAIQDQYVVFGSADSTIYCLDTENGTLVWKYKTMAAVLGCPIIKNDIVFIGGSDRTFKAIDLKTGITVWQFDNLLGFVETKPAFYNGKILFGAWDELFYCLDAETGKLIWKWKGDHPGVLYSPAACWPVVSDKIVFYAAPDRMLTAIDIETGNQIWRTGKYQVRETVGLSEDGNKLFIRTMDDTILALPIAGRLEKPLWVSNCKFGYDISSAQIVEKDGTVFYGTKNGEVFLLNSESGVIKFKQQISDGYLNTIFPVSNKDFIATGFEGKVLYFSILEE